jgi:hypothetical protein
MKFIDASLKRALNLGVPPSLAYQVVTTATLTAPSLKEGAGDSEKDRRKIPIRS